MIPQSTFDNLAQNDKIIESTKFLIPGSVKHIGNWSNQGLQNALQDDGVWVITASFTIFTMTSGFGLLESGRVSTKDEVNIMVKNVVDVIFGGLAYWMFGFGLTFGESDTLKNKWIGTDQFFFDPGTPDEHENSELKTLQEGWTYASFIYQMSFATTTSAIVSAGMAERVRLKAYIVISFVMTLIHSVPAHWVWADNGYLYEMGVIDSAGCGAVHLVGGIAGLIATLYLKPRHHRFGKKGRKQLSNPTNAILGTFMLWWGWLAFNTGSTYGVSQGKWKLAASSAVATIMASTGGGFTALLISKYFSKGIQIDMLIDGLLAALVSTTACSPCLTAWQAVVIGSLGAFFGLLTYPLCEKLEIDDPVGVVPVHVIGAVWGLLSAGLFAEADPFNYEVTRKQSGLFYGGGFELLKKQCIAIGLISAWSAGIGFITLFTLQHSPIGLRLTKYEEEIGADLREHGLRGHSVKAYRVEKKLTPESTTRVLLVMMKWRARAKVRAKRRLQAQQAAEAEAAQQQGIEMNVISNREEDIQSRQQSIHTNRSQLSRRK